MTPGRPPSRSPGHRRSALAVDPNEYLVTNTPQAQELQYNTDNSYSEMRNDETSKRLSISMFCLFALRYVNYRCYIGVLELAVYSLLGIRYFSFYLYIER